MKPNFEITADDKRVTDLIKSRLVSLHITSSTKALGGQDALTLVLSDAPTRAPDGTQQYLKLPARGVTMECAIGYEHSGLQGTGSWVCSGVEVQGGINGDVIVITATSVDPGSEEVEFKSRSWHKTTLGEILRTIAAEHGVEPKIDDKFENLPVEHIDQADESDMHFLTRLSIEYNVMGKFWGDYLIFSERGTGQNTKGEDWPTVRIEKRNLSSWSMAIPVEQRFQSVEIRYKDFQTGKIHTIQRGEGSPVSRVQSVYFSKESAEHYADQKLKALKQRREILSLKGVVTEGNLLLPETTLRLPHSRPDGSAEFRPDIAGDWRIQTQQLTLDAKAGFFFEAQCIRAEDGEPRPNG